LKVTYTYRLGDVSQSIFDSYVVFVPAKRLAQLNTPQHLSDYINDHFEEVSSFLPIIGGGRIEGILKKLNKILDRYHYFDPPLNTKLQTILTILT